MAIVGGGLPGLLTALAVRHACPGATVKIGINSIHAVKKCSS